MNVLIIADTFPKITESFILNHAAALIEAGHRVTVVARRDGGEDKAHPAFSRLGLAERTLYFDMPPSLPGRLLRAPARIRRSDRPLRDLDAVNPLKYGLGALNLHNLYRASIVPPGGFDVVHCHYGAVGSGCLYYRERLNAPLAVSFHGCDLRSPLVGRFYYRRMFRDSDAIVANSGYTRGRLLEHGCEGGKVAVIPAFSGIPDARRRPPVWTNPAEPNLLCVARLVEAKGVQFAVRAVRMVRDRGVAASLDVAGDGPHRPALEAMARELCPPGAVRFHGRLCHAELEALYARADLLAAPSVRGRDGWVETQGIVIQEAHQRGIPVAGSDIGGIPESVNFGRAGRLFPPGGAEALAEIVLDLSRRPEAARALGREGRYYHEIKYSRRAVLSKTLELYERMIESFGRAVPLPAGTVPAGERV